MRRLNQTELDARIHNFLERKFAEFPELDQKAAGLNKVSRRREVRHFRPRMRWGTAL